MNSYNLIDKKWIPTNAGMRSLKDVFSDESISIVGSNSTEKLCLLKFLFAVGQAACSFSSLDEIVSISEEDFKQRILDYLDENYDKFWLYSDENRPFLQFPELKAYDDSKKFYIEKAIRNIDEKTISNSNNGKIIHDSDWSKSNDHIYTDAEKALLLIVNLGSCLSSKDAFHAKGKPEMIVKLTKNKDYIKYEGKGGNQSVNSCFSMFSDSKGILHGFVMGSSILKTVLLNLVPSDLLDDYTDGLVKEFGATPWDYENMTEDCDYKHSFFAYLIPMNRFILLKKDSNSCLHTEGISYNTVSSYHGDTPYQLTQPSIFVFDKIEKNGGKKNTEEAKKVTKVVVRPSSEMHPLVSLHALKNNNVKSLNMQIKLAKDIAYQRDDTDIVTLMVIGTEYKQGMEGTTLIGYVQSSVDINAKERTYIDELTNKVSVIYDNIDLVRQNINFFFKKIYGVGNLDPESKYSSKNFKSMSYSKFDEMKKKIINSSIDDNAELKKFNSFLRNNVFEYFIKDKQGCRMNSFKAMSEILFKNMKYSFNS